MGCFGLFGVVVVCGWVHVTAIICGIAAVPWLLWGENWAVLSKSRPTLICTVPAWDAQGGLSKSFWF